MGNRYHVPLLSELSGLDDVKVKVANVESDMTGTLTSPGFRMQREQEKLTVAREISSSLKRKRVVILGFCVVFAFTICAVEIVRVGNGAEYAAIPWALLCICAIAPLLFALGALFPSVDELLCARETISITRTLRGKGRDVRTFQIADVRRLQYISEMFPWLGAAGCLGFLASGKQITCLSGLKHGDARIILDELRRLGFDVVHNADAAAEGQFDEGSGEPPDSEQK
jgi:hypothetical protein